MNPRQLPVTGGVLMLALLASAQFSAAQPARPMSATLPSEDATRDTNLSAYVELLRSDLRSQKIAIITEMMQFTEAEDAKFWPVYREYETELAKINDDRIALIKEYADGYETLTDDAIDRLATRVLELDGRRNALATKNYERLKSVLPPKTAARFLQVERQILLILDLQIAASLPIVSR
jgi:hypothetical protein